MAASLCSPFSLLYTFPPSLARRLSSSTAFPSFTAQINPPKKDHVNMARQLAEALLLNGLAPVAGPWQAASVLLVELAALLHVADRQQVRVCSATGGFQRVVRDHATARSSEQSRLASISLKPSNKSSTEIRVRELDFFYCGFYLITSPLIYPC